MKIGIDFGTTNTSAYYRIDGGDPKPFVLENRICLFALLWVKLISLFRYLILFLIL